MNPRSTDSETDALTTTPPRWSRGFCTFTISFYTKKTLKTCDVTLFSPKCGKLSKKSYGKLDVRINLMIRY